MSGQRDAYLTTHQARIERELSKALEQALAELAPDPVLRIGQLLTDLAYQSSPASKPSLVESVSHWQKAQQPVVLADGAAVSHGSAAAAELSAKFAASNDSFTFTYAGVAQFFAGLEGLVGSPSPEVMETMAREHASDVPFDAWNSDVKRTTTPRAEWAYVVEARESDGEKETRSSDERASARVLKTLHECAELPQVKKASLLLAEVAGVRLYTGPMYVLYNNVLRTRSKGTYVTSLHAINSAIIKLSRHTPASTVYRGVAGGVLPDEFWTPNDMGVMGGVELGFMSTTTERDVALGYMRQTGKAAKMLLEVRMGMIDRGADVAALSQFPAEREILFAPLTGLEVASAPRVEGDVIVVELRLSCNLHDLTLDQVVGKMQTGHLAMLRGMEADLELAGAPRAALRPLERVSRAVRRLSWSNLARRCPCVHSLRVPTLRSVSHSHTFIGRCHTFIGLS